METKNALLWEIKRFYNHKFLIGKEALQIIKNKLGIQLPEDEAGFIALHIVNAQLEMSEPSQPSIRNGEDNSTSIKHCEILFQDGLDEYSLNDERFVTHLKIFVQRLFSGVDLHMMKPLVLCFR